MTGGWKKSERYAIISELLEEGRAGGPEKVAKNIAETLGADTFEIVPKEVYSREDLNWTKNDSRVSVEHNDESKRNVELANANPENWDSYDTVFVGYPIWWGIAAWPVDNFIKGNDFTGKTVIPFCTSATSGLGQSADLLEEMAGKGNWAAGKRFGQNPSKEEVQDWLKEIQ